jgi:hypothetical protein
MFALVCNFLHKKSITDKFSGLLCGEVLCNLIYVDCKMKDEGDFAISLSNFMCTFLMAQGLLKYICTFGDANIL